VTVRVTERQPSDGDFKAIAITVIDAAGQAPS
jgi:hypothetical protein